MQVDNTCSLEMELVGFVEAAVHLEMPIVLDVEISSFAPSGEHGSQIVEGVPELGRRDDFFADFIEHGENECKISNLKFENGEDGI